MSHLFLPTPNQIISSRLKAIGQEPIHRNIVYLFLFSLSLM
ncbi:hypothetical protein [Zarconia navalis]|nr:hypothetical protein [Zarconia navalis]